MAYALQYGYMQLILGLILLITLFLNKTYAVKYNCLEATKKYEQLYELPKNLLLSMSLIESGRRLKNGEFVSWPWTINIKGKGKFFKDKKSALSFVKKYTSKGKKNIDIGCMQINYMYHPKAFNSFDEAFEPEINVKRAAELLKKLYKKFGSWKEAVGYYHSYRTSRRIKYSSKVFNKWLDIKNKNQYANILNPPLIKENIIIKKQVKNYSDKRNEKEFLHTTAYKNSITKKEKNKQKENIQNPYIVSRMEKVKFFRNYFSQTRSN